MPNTPVPASATGLPIYPAAFFGSAAFPIPPHIDTSRVVLLGPDDEEHPYYSFDSFGILRNAEGMPETCPGTATPMGFVDLHEDTPAVTVALYVACGLAAAAWSSAGGEATTRGRDAVLCLVEDACPIGDRNLAEAFALAEHELQPARDRVAERLVTNMDFARRFAEARATMNAGCAFFPWYRGDGQIPG